MKKAPVEPNQLPKELQLYSYEEAAIILKVKRGTIRTWVYRGVIRENVRMGRKALIPLSEIQRFVAERTNKKIKK